MTDLSLGKYDVIQRAEYALSIGSTFVFRFLICAGKRLPALSQGNYLESLLASKKPPPPDKYPACSKFLSFTTRELLGVLHECNLALDGGRPDILLAITDELLERKICCAGVHLVRAIAFERLNYPLDAFSSYYWEQLVDNKNSDITDKLQQLGSVLITKSLEISRTGRAEEACQVLSAVSSALPKLKNLNYGKAICYASLGRNVEAINCLRQELQDYPESRDAAYLLAQLSSQQ